MRIYTIRELTETRLCAAEACEGEAEAGSRLCFRCERKDDVKLHVLPELELGDTLRCSGCGQFKPDAAFARVRKKIERRSRHPECRACHRARRTKRQRQGPPAQRCVAIATSRKARHPGQQCLGYAIPGSLFCGSHRGLNR